MEGPTLWGIPPAPEVFTGRVDERAQIGSVLGDKQRVALVGLPGVGKSATARQWASENRSAYRYGFHIIADTPENTRTGYHRAAQSLNLPGVTPQDETTGVPAFLDWLGEASHTLLILDNADRIGDGTDPWRALLPPRGEAHILLTARPDTFKPIVSTVRLSTMDESTGAECVLQWAGIDTPSDNQTADARALSLDLGGLPLALRQAGRYCGVNGASLRDYQALLAQRQGDLLNLPVGMSGEEKTVYQTFQIALGNLGDTESAALALMRMVAFLSPDAIPEELFTEHADDLPDTLAPVAGDPMQWDALRGTLLRYALITEDSERHTFDVHRLLQEVIRHAMPEEEQAAMTAGMVALLNHAFPLVNFTNWSLCERLTPHTLVVLERARRHNYRTDAVARLLNQAGFYLNERGRYVEALPLYEEALGIYREVLPPRHPLIATSLNNLAALYQSQGKFIEAVPLFEESLAIRREVLPPRHPDIATSLNNLAGLYQSQGKFIEALPLYEEALGIRREGLPSRHPDIANGLNNLAELYRAQGKYAEALPLYEEALAIRREVLPPRHPDIATSLNNLAELYRAQGKFIEALPLYEEALGIRREVLPPRHPDIASSLNNLAGLYQSQGKFIEALPLFEEALGIYREVLPPRHPDIMMSAGNLAGSYRAQGNYTEALPLYQEALSISRESLPARHPHIATSLNNLAGLYESQGKFIEALPLFEEALGIRREGLPPRHPAIASSLNNLAALYESQGKYGEALPLYTEAVAIMRTSLGEAHPNTKIVTNNAMGVIRKMAARDKGLFRTIVDALFKGQKRDEPLAAFEASVRAFMERLG